MEPLCESIHLKIVLENNFQGPMFIRGSHPHQHKQPLFGYTEPLCGLIHLKTLLEINFQGPMFIRVPPPPPSTQKVIL